MAHLTNAHFLSIIERLPPGDFDSHDVIEKITRTPEIAQLYIRELNDAIDHDDPFKDVHSSIGRRLAGLPELMKVDRVASTNVGGTDTDNQVWRRR
ncbi:MAG: hypothetical protein RIT81_31430 [Deltaproteobacteria bacterium]